MDADEDDYVFYGTPIEREEELTSRKKKAVAEASGHLRSLPSWKQEVRDEEGRRRFHGAFTGGFSAGYYNTVGSKEGWTPSSFTSSRKNRAEVKKQSIHNFLDEDERAELEARSLGTSSQFDTFGFTAAEVARRQAEKEQQHRQSVIPGPVPDEIVLPAAQSIGVTLLLKMGWRHGHSIKDSRASSLYDARREARKALLAFSSDNAKGQFTDYESGDIDLENVEVQSANDDFQSSRSTPVYVLNPKQDIYGLGYDPYKHAPEFREKKRSHVSGKETGVRKVLSIKDSLFGLKSGKAASGFGIGALEEYDAEDEDIYTTAYDLEDSCVQEDEETSMDHRKRLVWKEEGVLPGFRVASTSDFMLERFDPPAIPKDFVPHHKFQGPLDIGYQQGFPPPPEIPPPEDNNQKILIEGVATLVARCGKLFEDLSREKNKSNPLFSFLSGGNGHQYYVRKLWEERQKHIDQRKPALDGKSSTQKMNAESRGQILGERPLERSSKDLSMPLGSANVNLQFNLSDTFTQPSSFSELPEETKPFKNDPAKQERFERFLKEKYQGGLRPTDSGGVGLMSEAARARERLDFEAAAEAIEKGKSGKGNILLNQQFVEFSASESLQFTSGGLVQGKNTQSEDLSKKTIYPRREEFPWRPSSILCKRFDLIDPFMGKPPPPRRAKSKIDSLIFMSDSVKSSKVGENVSANKAELSVPQFSTHETNKDVDNRDGKDEIEVENVERPVDLYKAIFSDDSENEVEASNVSKVDNPEKKVEVAETALNRLITGDFLESLGKELGLEVPPDVPHGINKTRTSTLQKETAITNAGDMNVFPVENKSSSSPNVSGKISSNQGGLVHQEIREENSHKDKTIHGSASDGSSRYMQTSPPDNKPGKVGANRTMEKEKKAKSSPSHHHNWSDSSSSEDERDRKRYRQRGSKSTDSYSDSSSGHLSRSKGRKKHSSREKRRGHRKHSKHHRHRSRDSSRRHSYHASEKELAEAKREKRKRRD
ncbi:hypothetical protein K2173_003961 [Erythroxylum novogranatense]|uniref:SURP motif domain-containing protein n=1 Tax=Erythroxylum novogranatense TaxID=1862640 RepID=A0AAV8SK95_9ROSI|nr:hypothetical protein K2173_003961 [Erythroxylum novogranatense]